MDRILDQRGEEKRLIHEVVARRPLPKNVDAFEIEFGEDWTGDPAVTIWLSMARREAQRSDAYQELGAFIQATEHELVALGLPHWPFVRVRMPSHMQRQPDEQ